MARTGNPNGPGLPEWPEYQPASDVTLVMAEAFTPVQGLSKDVLDFLEERALIRRRGYDQPGAH
jgi:para-nitrobenzyl esterase